jgi:3-deoxy-manno-octulosonate cytidylyltransferase (CMP-KDO synthetase)
MKILGIIPARYASTRFPGKPLALIGDKTMVQRVIEQAIKSTLLDNVVVATDDERIAQHVVSLGHTAVLTSHLHHSGTDRCLEALNKQATHYDAVINIQGDEPFVDPIQIDALAKLITQPEVDIATLAIKITDSKTLFDHNKVKVVLAADGKALLFSRQPIPFQKNYPPDHWVRNHNYYKHLGLYAYKSAVLKKICALAPSSLEISESLEQLRWLENGFHIHVALTTIETPAVDTPEDLQSILTKL